MENASIHSVLPLAMASLEETAQTLSSYSSIKILSITKSTISQWALISILLELCQFCCFSHGLMMLIIANVLLLLF